jgi:SecD/SecF fusion protein
MDGSSFLNSPIITYAVDFLVLAQTEINGTDSLEKGTTNEWEAYGFGALFVLGIFVVPFVLSHFITKAIRMPAHSFRLGVMLAAIFAGLLFAFAKDFELTYGPDMKGGTTLVYDIMPDEEGKKLDAGALATALSDRINPSGTKEISIRPRGESQIEITVPMIDEFELAEIKRKLIQSGQLQFRIVANTRDHQTVKDLADDQASKNALPAKDVLDASGKSVGRWFTVQRDAEKVQGIFPLKTSVQGDFLRDKFTGKILNPPSMNPDDRYAFEKWMLQQGIKDVEVLMALQGIGGKPYAEVQGDDLASAATQFDKLGQPVVEFRLTGEGSRKMMGLTSANQPDGNFHRRMAIIMDDQVLSAPQLNSPISSSGEISGRFTKEEVDFLVNILRSGRLPATLSKEPASEERVGAGLGATTIQKGTNASFWAVVATFASMLLYYRFAGVVASMALIINGILIFGVMIFIGQPLTLPGLAGLVLTVGMSVDANVLIFERIREEKTKGSASRMAIRNGFDRAFTTIVDSNLTTLIAAIVLYWIGTDQVRGFAVALIIGIATSMFTATFCSRIVFEMAEKLKLVSLSMSDGVGFIKKSFFGDKDFNFMGWRNASFLFSSALIVIGLIAVTLRGKDILNIDFTGGTSVTFQTQEPIVPDQLRQITKAFLTVDENDKPVQSALQRVEKLPLDTYYTLTTSIGSREYLSKLMLDGFAKDNSADLVTYRVKIRKVAADEAANLNANVRVSKMVSYQADASIPTPEQEAAEVPEVPAAPETAAEALTTEPVTTEPTPTSSEPQASVPSATEGEATVTTPAVVGEAATDADLAIAVPATSMVTFILEVGSSNGDNANVADKDKVAKIDGATLKKMLIDSAVSAGVTMNDSLVEVVPEPKPELWQPDDVKGYSAWRVSLPVDDAASASIVAKLELAMQQQPLWLSLSQIGSKVAGEMQQRAVAAILVSLIFIVGYIWFRFQKISYGLAAVIALIHDVLITLGVIAICHWLAGPLGFLLIEDFKIGLTEVAAFLTIIGYSLNDTIVVFDRIREVRGRSPKLDANMVNASVNQTLSRTLLTSGTTLLTVFLLYVFGGEGIHAFAFALLVGILIGTYSSIFVASPILLWLTSRETSNQRPGVVS